MRCCILQHSLSWCWRRRAIGGDDFSITIDGYEAHVETRGGNTAGVGNDNMGSAIDDKSIAEEERAARACLRRGSAIRDRADRGPITRCDFGFDGHAGRCVGHQDGLSIDIID